MTLPEGPPEKCLLRAVKNGQAKQKIHNLKHQPQCSGHNRHSHCLNPRTRVSWQNLGNPEAGTANRVPREGQMAHGKAEWYSHTSIRETHESEEPQCPRNSWGRNTNPPFPKTNGRITRLAPKRMGLWRWRSQHGERPAPASAVPDVPASTCPTGDFYQLLPHRGRATT